SPGVKQNVKDRNIHSLLGEIFGENTSGFAKADNRDPINEFRALHVSYDGCYMVRETSAEAPRSLSLPHAGRHQQLTPKKRTSRANQARADHFHCAAVVFQLKLHRKLAAWMLNREPLHGSVMRLHDTASDGAGENTCRAHRHRHQDSDGRVTFVRNKGAGHYVPAGLRRRNQSYLWNYLRTHVAQTHALPGQDANRLQPCFEFLVGVKVDRGFVPGFPKI